MSKIMSLFENIVKIIGVTYFFTIIIGFIELKTYYGQFGIAINEYITTSEVLFSSLDKILLIFIILLIQIGIWLYHFNYLFDYNLEESIRDGEPRPRKYHNETIRRLFKSKFLKVYWLIIICTAFLFVILNLIYPKSEFIALARDFFMLNYWMAMCIYLMWLQATKALWESMKLKQPNAKALITIFVFLFVLVTSIWLKNNILFNRIRKYGTTITTEIILNDHTKIINNDTIRYVGRTGNYFFYWHKLTKQVTIYPVSEVKKIVLDVKL